MKFFGVNASDSAEFSFLLSVPVILAGAAVEIYQAIQTQISMQWYVVLIGVVAAFLSGLVSVKTVMRAVKNNRWVWFAVYLVVPLTISLIVL